MARLWKRYPAGTDTLEEAQLHNIRLTRPAIVFLPGIFTVEGKEEHLAEGMRDIARLFSRHNIAPPDIYGLSHSDLGTIFNIASYNMKPQEFYSRAAEQTARAVILPLVTENGRKIATEDAARNLRRLTLVGYSAGTVFAQEMYNAARALLAEAGYKKKDAQALLQEIVLVSMAAVSRPTQEKDRFTTLYLAASNDLAVRLKNTLWRPLSRLFSRHKNHLEIRALSQNSIMATAGMTGRMTERQEHHDGSAADVPVPPLLPARMHKVLHSHHEMPHYMTCDDDHNGFSRLVLHALANALRRDRKLAPQELIAPPQDLCPQNIRDAFNARVAAGEQRARNRRQKPKPQKTKEGKKDAEKNSGRPRLHAAPPHPKPGKAA